MKVTELPGQNGFAVGDIVTLTGSNGLTVSGYWVLVAGLFVVQVSEDVSTHETRSPSTGIKEYVKRFVPTLIPFTFHW